MRRVAILGGVRIPFCRAYTGYADLSNLDMAMSDSGAKVTHDSLPTVLADETQLVQLFQNLIANAIKYRRPGVPMIHVSSSTPSAICTKVIRFCARRFNFSSAPRK